MSTNEQYSLWGIKASVGDFITTTDSTSYVGRITYISRDGNIVQHQCVKTGKVSTKSYNGFGARYQIYAQRNQKNYEKAI